MARLGAVPAPADLLKSIQEVSAGLTLAVQGNRPDSYPATLPLSADSRDIPAYVDQR